MTEEQEIKESYTRYQFGTTGVETSKEDAFRQGWKESKEFFLRSYAKQLKAQKDEHRDYLEENGPKV